MHRKTPVAPKEEEGKYPTGRNSEKVKEKNCLILKILIFTKRKKTNKTFGQPEPELICGNLTSSI